MRDEEREEEEREKRGFRVVDRRRFTEDGETRDDAPADPEPVAAPEPVKPSAPEARAETPKPAPAETATEEIPEPTGRIDFISFIASLATNAMAALGALPEAQSQGMPRNPELAREYIDIISMLHYKTQGNLSPQEAAAMSRITSDLKMAYVQMTGDFKSGQ